MQQEGLIMVYVSVKLNYFDLEVGKGHLRFVIFSCSKETVLVNFVWICLLFPRVIKDIKNTEVYFSTDCMTLKESCSK